MNSNWNSEQVKLWLANFLTALEQTANRWSTGIFVLIKTIGALFGLAMLMAAIIVLTQWFIVVYGMVQFILTIVLTSFVLTALSAMSNKKS